MCGGDAPAPPPAAPGPADAPPPPPTDAPPADPPTSDAPPADDDEECGFCVFMKGGGCKAAFEAWAACVDAARGDGGDFADACRAATLELQACMERNPEYYGDFIVPRDGEEEEQGGEGGEKEAGTDEGQAAGR